MKIGLAQLQTMIAKQGLSPFYLLSGDDPYLNQQALQVLLTAIDTQTEKMRILLNNTQAWESLAATLQMPSLFAPKRLIIINIPSFKLPAQAQTYLQQWLTSPPAKDKLIFCVSKLTAKERQIAWIKQLLAQAVDVECLAPTQGQFPSWVKQQFAERSITTDSAGINLFCHYFADNPGMALQELEKLNYYLRQKQLGNTKDKITILATELEIILTQQGQFSVYQLLDTCFAGDIQQCLRIYQQIIIDESQALLITWSLARELRTLIALAIDLQAGKSLGELSKTYRLWPQKLALYQKMLARHTLSSLWSLLAALARVDQSNKGFGLQDSQQLLTTVLQQTAGAKINL